MNEIPNDASVAAGIPAFLAKGAAKVTVIGEHSNLLGDISIREGEDLLIEGCVVGNIFHGGKVVVGGAGIVIGSIFASELEVHGVVDAAEGEILASNLVVHGTSRIKATEVTVATGCMNYERGGFMNAQLGMVPAGEVNARIESLLDAELSKAANRRQAVEKAREQAKAVRETAARVVAAPAEVPTAVSAPIAADVKSPVAQAQSIPVPATLRAAIALVPPVVDGEDDVQAAPRAAYGS